MPTLKAYILHFYHSPTIQDFIWDARRLLRPARPGSTTVVMTGDFQVEPLAINLLHAFRIATSTRRVLPRWIMRMEGMSGRRYRKFINSLVARVPEPVYLEIGSYGGSTACAAVAGNDCYAICIDDWSEYGRPRERFFGNFQRARPGMARAKIIEQDFRQVDFEGLEPKANIYLFDGPHSEQDHFDSLFYALPALQDRFVFIVDDYNRDVVRDGTARALDKLRLTVDSSIVIRTNADGIDQTYGNQRSDWHAGYLLAVVSKSSK